MLGSYSTMVINGEKAPGDKLLAENETNPINVGVPGLLRRCPPAQSPAGGVLRWGEIAQFWPEAGMGCCSRISFRARCESVRAELRWGCCKDCLKTQPDPVSVLSPTSRSPFGWFKGKLIPCQITCWWTMLGCYENHCIIKHNIGKGFLL